MSETFAQTFKRILKYDEPQDSFPKEYMFPEAIELMEIYFDKLNNTVVMTREVFIADKLFPAMLEYASNDLTKLINERHQDIRSSDKKAEVEKNIRIIQKFEDMIYKYLDGQKVENTLFIENKDELQKTMPNRPSFEVELMIENGKKQNTIGNLLETAKQLRRELETKEYYYFQSGKFYPDDLIPKTEIRELLKQYAKDENLKGYSIEIKQFVDNL